MSQFDPYRKWLGIPETNRPPNLYELLGVPLFEEDIEVLHNAADARMSYVRTFTTGPHSVLSQRILNEISQARVVLCDHRKKPDYDVALRNSFSAAPQALEVREALPTSPGNPATDSISINAGPNPKPKRRRSFLPLLISLVLAAVFAIVILQLGLRANRENVETVSVEVSDQKEPADNPGEVDQQPKPVIDQPPARIVEERPARPHAKDEPAAGKPSSFRAKNARLLDQAARIEDLERGRRMREFRDINTQPQTERGTVTLDLGKAKMRSDKIAEKRQVKVVGLQSPYRTYFEPFDGVVGKDTPVNIRFVDDDHMRVRCELLDGRMILRPQLKLAQNWISLTKQSIKRIHNELMEEGVNRQANIRRLQNQRVPAAQFNAARENILRLQELLQEVRNDVERAEKIESIVTNLHGRARVEYEVTVEPPIVDARENN